MEDDATRTPRARSESARPPAALFMEPQVPSANGARPEPASEPAPIESAPVESRADTPEPGPEPEEPPATRRATPRKAAKKAVPATKATKPETTRPVAEAPKDPWWARTPTRTSAVPAYLAEVAVERYGDSALRYVDWLRARYPEATPDGLANLVEHRVRQTARYTVLAGPIGLLAAQARLVLLLAAAYGRDPRAPERVPELLAILAPKALAASAAARLAGRVLPGAGLVAASLAGAGALERTAVRSRARYAAD